MSTDKGTYQAPAGAAVPVKGEVVATQPAEAPIAATVAAMGASAGCVATTSPLTGTAAPAGAW